MYKLFYLSLFLLITSCNKKITHNGNILYDPNGNNTQAVKQDNNTFDNFKTPSPYVNNDNTYNDSFLYSNNVDDNKLTTALNNYNNATQDSALQKQAQSQQIELINRADFKSTNNDNFDKKNTPPKKLNTNNDNQPQSNYYTIQCGVYSNKTTAQSLAEDLKDNGLQDVQVVNEGNRYKVFVGKFDSKKEGQKAFNQVEQSGLVSGAFWKYITANKNNSAEIDNQDINYNNNNEDQPQSNYYTIQCGVYSNKTTAQSLAEDLKDNGLQDVQVVNEGNRYKVFVGKFDSKKEGQKAFNQVEQSGLVSGAFWVYKK